MSNNFSPSVNVSRDLKRGLDYIVSTNAENAYRRLFIDYKKGSTSFCIIGSYGTGKSAFLVQALSTIESNTSAFTKFSISEQYDTLIIEGRYESLIKVLSNTLGVRYESADAIVNALKKKVIDAQKIGKRFLLCIDEFGKFLEFAGHSQAEKELFLVQVIASANSVDNGFHFITTLHQNFSAYNQDFNSKQTNEWTKVKGRLVEIPFNEPVQHLLSIAAKKLSTFQAPNELEVNIIQKLVNESGILGRAFNPGRDVIKNLYPLDYVSAVVLCQALQKYGQNDRSLFTFLSDSEKESVNNIDLVSGNYFSIPNVYDYLQRELYSFLNTNQNPDFIQWRSTLGAIERVHTELNDRIEDLVKIIKTISLLGLLGNRGKKINGNFLKKYAQYFLKISDVEYLLVTLEQKKIIRYVDHQGSFKIFDGSDMDINFEINKATKLISSSITQIDITSSIKNQYDGKHLIAKRYSFNFGTPRIFDVQIIDNYDPMKTATSSEFDGTIYLLFKESPAIENWSKNVNDASVFAQINESERIKELIIKLAAISHVVQENQYDLVAVRELKSLESSLKNEINQLVNEGLYRGKYKWYISGETKFINSYNELQLILSDRASIIYPYTPTFKNELINKYKLSSTISTAKNRLFEAIVSNYFKQDLDFDQSKFPPEKAIYLTLLKNTGIHRFNEESNRFELGPPEIEEFEEIWKATNNFYESSKYDKRNLKNLYDLLAAPPFGMKDGFLQFWIPLSLLIKEHDIALYYQDKFVTQLNTEILSIVMKGISEFNVKSFEVDGVRLSIFNQYRLLSQQSDENRITKSGFIETIKPWISFYRRLPEFTKTTRKHLSIEAIRFLEAIRLAKDPEALFFNDLPIALGFEPFTSEVDQVTMVRFTQRVKEVVNESRNNISELRGMLYKFISKEIGRIKEHEISVLDSFGEIKEALIDRYASIDTDILLDQQRLIFNRIISPLPDSETWLNSLITAIVGRQLHMLDDQLVVLFKKRFSDFLFEMDNLLKLDLSKINHTDDLAFSIQLTSLKHPSEQMNVYFSKTEIDDNDLKRIKKHLPLDDKRKTRAILAILLEETIQNEN
jgi:hypothetical protein